jgi:hypothetical protein
MKEEFTEIVRTFEAVGPLVGNAVKSGHPLPERRAPPQARLFE